MTKDKFITLIENYAQSKVDVETAKQGGWLLSESMIVLKIRDAYKAAVMKAVEDVFK